MAQAYMILFTVHGFHWIDSVLELDISGIEVIKLKIIQYCLRNCWVCQLPVYWVLLFGEIRQPELKIAALYTRQDSNQQPPTISTLKHWPSDTQIIHRQVYTHCTINIIHVETVDIYFPV